jgi:CBS domain containing-hemolysin-like protein
MIWFVFLACLVVSFTFSGIESGVISINRVRLRHRARHGEEAAQTLDRLLFRNDRLVMTVVLITNVANFVALAVLYTHFSHAFGPAGGAVASLVVGLPVFLFVLEFLPKAIFRRFPYRTLVVFARILTVVDWVLAPIVSLGAWLASPFLRGGREAASGRIVSVADLKRAVTGTAGKPAERALIEHIVDFRSLRASDLMLPLDNVPRAAPEMEIAALLRKASEVDASRFLVFDSDGHVAGLVRVIDLLLDDVRSGRAQSYMRRVVTVRGEDSAIEALTKLRAARLPLAVVLDGNGYPAGVLTSGHLARRLLGGSR